MPSSPVTIDMTQVEDLAKRLRQMTRKGIPYAVRDLLNNQAFKARELWPTVMGKSFVLRNRWTVGSIRVEKVQGAATPQSLATMQSRVGSELSYLATQEHGGEVRPTKGEHKPIPTASAAGQAMRARPRTKQVQRRNMLGAIQLYRSNGGKTRRQRNAIAIRKVLAKGGGVVFLNLGRRRGLFRVQGGKRQAKIRMLYDLSQRQVRVRARPTLKPTVAIVRKMGPRMAHAALLRQVDMQLRGKGFAGPIRSGR